MKVFTLGRSYLCTETYKVEAATLEEAEKILEETSCLSFYHEKTHDGEYLGSFDYIEEHDVKEEK